MLMGDKFVRQDNGKPFKLVINPVDDAGNPAPIDGKPDWQVSDSTVATLVAADDGLSATVTLTKKVGECQISVTADADTGDGVSTISGTLDLQVVAGPATNLNLQVQEIP